MSCSKKSKILFFCHPEQDYGEFFLWDGLCRILGDENAVTFPWKRSYFGIIDDQYILDDGKQGKTGPSPYMKKRYVAPWSEEKVRSSLDEFVLWVLASPRTYAKDGLRKFIHLKKSNIPLAFCDHEDSLTVRQDLIREFKPDFIFKRELTQKMEGIHPLPFSSVCLDFVENKQQKIIDVFCCFGLTHPIRKKIRDLLQTDGRLKKYRVEARCNNCGDPMLGYKEYLEVMSWSKINILARGHGLDTVRHFEMPAYSGLVLADKPPLIVPNDYEDNKHIVYYKNDLSDLVEKIIYYLEHDEERKRIGTGGFGHTRQYHTTICRAEYFLSICGVKVEGVKT